MPIQDWITSVVDAFTWRWDSISNTFVARVFAPSLEWRRLVMDRTTGELVRALPYRDMRAVEISGNKWKDFGFQSYESVGLPEYDVCQAPLAVSSYDLIIIEQVLEHVLWPYRAVRHLHAMLRPSGLLLVTTPFLIKLHGAPVDCSRWTELGMKHLLAEAGFVLDDIRTGSWGNRMCVRRGLRNTPEGIAFLPWWHSLRNEPNYPVVVWALARKSHERAG